MLFLLRCLIFLFSLSVTFNLYADNIIRGRVLSIIDGDTIKIALNNDEKFNVRMTGIDTPETHYRGQSQGFYAELATEYLKRRLPVNSIVKIRASGDDYLDLYGRILGRVFYKGKDLNRAILRSGLACLFIIYPFDEEIVSDYVKVAIDAVDSGRGIFDIEHPIEELPYVFRLSVSGRDPSRFVGDYETKKFYPPDHYPEIHAGMRIFFQTKKDALDAGYTEADI